MPGSSLELPAAAGVDWTALHNFAALRGQLRVSFTPRCNIACWFCHNEGDVPPPLTRQDRSRQPRAPQQLTGAEQDFTLGWMPMPEALEAATNGRFLLPAGPLALLLAERGRKEGRGAPGGS